MVFTCCFIANKKPAMQAGCHFPVKENEKLSPLVKKLKGP